MIDERRQIPLDLDYRALAATFVASLPARGDALEAALHEADVARLATIARRLRTAGTYGFPRIEEAAREVEASARAARMAQLPRRVAVLVALCRSAVDAPCVEE